MSLRQSVSQSVSQTFDLFSSNYSNPSTGGGISSDLCRRSSLGTSHSTQGRDDSSSSSTVLSLSLSLSTNRGGVWKWGLGIVSLCELVLKEIKKELKKQENLSLLYQQIKLMEHPGLLPPLPGLVGHRTFQQDRTKRLDIF